ncbi:methionyl-tRNA formyltransferase [Rariglobus hedericola]|uniref:Methionyl-tRNA formyltransferase n=1 Tax=Rariglobus hedericola TaxID=2597822 RepID=A0A556QN12_9BACT|nr:methionyl-tRNA formyltransferase [Rariglobus hedericola]TSJ78023.1 methionyl-tRNA formyltransferase [Rariglobus hedericola]
MLNIVFLGSDPIALPLLDWLAGEGSAVARVIAVFTQPDRPVGRGQKITANGIKTWALARGLPVYQPEKITEDVRAQLVSLNADVSLVMAYGHILKQDFIDTPRLGTLNLHASLLPKYRGASPIQTSIANSEKETGVSLMRIVRQLDAGPVADLERVAIAPRDTALDIELKLSAACVPLLVRTLPKLASGELIFVEQEHAAATFCRRMVKDDGALDFNVPATVLAARINGLFPWPACSVEVSGQPVKIGLADVPRAEAICNLISDKPAGTVLGADGEGLLVATGNGVLRCLRLQKPGGKMLGAPEFLRGSPIAAGTVLPSVALPPLVAATPFPYKKTVQG